MQVISRPLREDTRHTAAAVVGMRNANRSFQAEEVGQETLKLCLREGKVSTIGTASKASPVLLPKPSAICKRSLSLAQL